MEKLSLVKQQASIDKICIDVANGYTEKFVDVICRSRDENPDALIMAGNVVTGDMTEALLLAGADIVKLGIGPGSVCTTRKLTGVGYPQLSAIIECADAAHGLKGTFAQMVAARFPETSPRLTAEAPISSCLAVCSQAMTNARAKWCTKIGTGQRWRSE